MEYRILLRKKNIILAESKKDYIVGIGYDETQPIGQQWDHGHYFAKNVNGLSSAIETFRNRTEENYISRCRLEELATLFKDGLIEDNRESAMEYFEEVCEMDESEKEWFGLNENKENGEQWNQGK